MASEEALALNGLDGLVRQGFQVEFESHAKAILNIDYPDALREIESVLERLQIPTETLVRGGGGETDITQWMRVAFADLHWRKRKFEIKKLIDGVERESISHEVDHVRVFDDGKVAMEIEWNNKDPFFDRDLENFKRLHAEAAISVGIIITRGESLQKAMPSIIGVFAKARNLHSFEDVVAFGLERTTRQNLEVAKRLKRPGKDFATAWSETFVSDKFGESTTHWRKLHDRIKRGVGNPCPLLLIGIPASVITP